MPLKSEHFITPIKLVLPGIIVSLIGLSASNYIFNDPVKIRGRNSRSAWDNVVRYQKIYEENAEDLTCQYSSNTEYYFKDLIHLQEMTIENLKTLKDDKEIDKIMASIINLRIDTYSQLKNISVKFIDTLLYWDKIERTLNPRDSVSHKQLADIVEDIQNEYMNSKQHISTRDTSIIRRLGIDLQKSYTAFASANFRSPSLSDIIDTIHQKIIGKWSMVKDEMQVDVTFDKSNKGTMVQSDGEQKFSWKFLGEDSTKLNIDFENALIPDWTLDIPYCSPRLLQYKDVKKAGVVHTACRLN